MGQIINERFRIDFKVGEGSHGQVYEAYDLSTQHVVAIKTYKREYEEDVPREAVFLQQLQHLKAIPNFILHCSNGPTHFTAMQLVGPSLSSLRDTFFPLKVETVLSLSLKMLDRIFEVHNAGLIHGDVKPSNFAIGQPPNAVRRIYILDFSLTRRKDDPKNARAGKKRVFGTMRYAGCPRHLAEPHTELDDLYSFLYSLLDLRIKLPWRKEKDRHRVLLMKEELTDQLLLTILHHNFVEFKEYIDNLEEGSAPDHEVLKDFIVDAINSSKIETATPYEWERQPEKVWHEAKAERVTKPLTF